MNEQFQQYLMGILEKTGEFLGTEIPEIAHQILMFNLVQSSLLVLLSVTFLILYSYMMIRFTKEGIWPDYTMAPSIIGGFAALAAVPILFIEGSIVLKIWLAPKLYLLEYAADLVK